MREGGTLYMNIATADVARTCPLERILDRSVEGGVRLLVAALVWNEGTKRFHPLVLARGLDREMTSIELLESAKVSLKGAGIETLDHTSVYGGLANGHGSTQIYFGKLTDERLRVFLDRLMWRHLKRTRW